MWVYTEEEEAELTKSDVIAKAGEYAKRLSEAGRELDARLVEWWAALKSGRLPGKIKGTAEGTGEWELYWDCASNIGSAGFKIGDTLLKLGVCLAAPVHERDGRCHISSLSLSQSHRLPLRVRHNFLTNEVWLEWTD